MADSEDTVTVEQVMTTTVETVDAGASITDAADRLYDRRIGSLIVEEGGEAVGIVTETDIVEQVAAGNEDATVGEVASSPLITADPDEPIGDAAERMKRHTIKKLPVTDDADDLVGIVTTTDISNYFPSHQFRSEPA
jgi:CBS domain-containing protein